MKKTIYFLLLCVAGLLFSCSEDEGLQLHEHSEQSQNNYKRSIVSFEEMKSKLTLTNDRLDTLFSDLSNKDGEDYIQKIDTTYIIQYSNDTLTTYTMRVSTLDDENYIFSNLFIREYNGLEEEIIIHYNPAENWLTAYQNGEYVEYDGALIVTDIHGQTFENSENQGKAAQNCEYSIVPIMENSCGCHGGEEIVGYTLVINCGPGGGFGPPNYTGGGPTDPISGGGFGDPDNPGGGGGPYSDFDYFFLSGLTQQQRDWLNNNSIILGQIYYYLENNYYSDDAVDFATELTIFLVQENGIKDNLREAIANGITTTAEYTHKIFKKFSQWTNQYPGSITLINGILSGIKYGISDLVNTNPNTCTFADLFNMWLFELGANPLNINGLKITTNQLKNQEGVSQARVQAMIKIQTGNISTPVNHGWTYGQGEFYDGMQNGNFVTAFLGSYSTNVTITQLSNGYQLNFHVTNTSSWDSATRFRIDNNGDGYHDGIFPNTYRNINTDISLGGNFTQNWYWTEIVN